MELDKLLVKIEADLSDLKRGLDKANNEVKKSSSKMSNEFKKFGTTLSNIGGKVITFGGLFATAFGAYQIKQVVDVGRQIEDLQVRLKALFGSAEEGARAFDVMVKFASKVPFSLQEIQSASGNLAVVADDAQELAELLEITGNVAGATGLSFQQTAEQIQRSFSGGIASADVFRERGVRSMLGFQVGAEVSINETVEAFKRVFGKGGEFGSVTDDLANTLTGTLSMLEDKLFSFRKAIADEFMVEVKKQFGELNNSLAKSQSVIDDFGKKIGEVLAKAVKFFADNIQEIIDGLTSLALFLGTTAGIAILKFIKEMNKLTLALGAIVVLGDEAKEVLKGLTIELSKSAGRGGLNDDLRILESLSESATKNVDDLDDEFKKLGKSLEHTNEGVETYAEKWARISDVTREAKKSVEDFIITEGELKEIVQEVNKTFEDAGQSISDAFGDSIAKGQDFGDAMKNIFQDVTSQIISTIAQILIIKPLIDSLTASLTEYQEKQKGGIGASLGGGIGGLVSSVGSFLGFANGGYTPPNKPYMVGERGAELFVPKTAGNIVPNNELGGGVNVVQNISFSTGVVPTVRAEVLNLLPTIKQETINAVAEQRSRGGAFARTFGA